MSLHPLRAADDDNPEVERVIEVWQDAAGGYIWRRKPDKFAYRRRSNSPRKALAASRLELCPDCPTPTEWMGERKAYDCEHCAAERAVLDGEV